jgi:hypothetical protein
VTAILLYGTTEHNAALRHEVLLLVTDDGCELLTDFPYSLTPAGH